AIVAAGAEGQARDRNATLAQRDAVGGGARRGVQGQSANAADRSNGKRGFEKFAAGQWAHKDLLGWDGRAGPDCGGGRSLGDGSTRPRRMVWRSSPVAE